jgi:hypothetical protein
MEKYGSVKSLLITVAIWRSLGLLEAFSVTMDFLVKNCQLFFFVILLQGLLILICHKYFVMW